MTKNLPKAFWGAVLTVVAVGAIAGLTMAIISIVIMAPQLGHYPATGELVGECVMYSVGASIISLVIALGFCTGIALPFHFVMQRLRIHSFIFYVVAGFVSVGIFLMIEFVWFKPTTNQLSMFEYIGATALVAGPMAAAVFGGIALGVERIKQTILMLFLPYAMLLVFVGSLYKFEEKKDFLRPTVFSTDKLSRSLAGMDGSGHRVSLNLTTDECNYISKWVLGHQEGWGPATLSDYHPNGDAQIMCDNYGIGIESDYIVIGYYRNQYDLENDDDSEIKIKRPMTSDDHLFWNTEVAQLIRNHPDDVLASKKRTETKQEEVRQCTIQKTNRTAEEKERCAVDLEQQGEARMAAAMPDYFRPLLTNYIDPSSIFENPYIHNSEMHERRYLRLKPFHEALETKYYNRGDQIWALIKWAGTSRRLRSLGNQYGILVDELLLDYSTEDIIKVLNDHTLDEGEADAATVFFAYNVKYARPQDLHLLSPKLKKLFLSGAMRSEDEDLKKRAQDAFGKRERTP